MQFGMSGVLLDAAHEALHCISIPLKDLKEHVFNEYQRSCDAAPLVPLTRVDQDRLEVRHGQVLCRH